MSVEVRRFAHVDNSVLQYLGFFDSSNFDTRSCKDKQKNEISLPPDPEDLNSSPDQRQTSATENRWLTSPKVEVAMSPSKCLLAIAHDGEASFMKVYDDYAAKDHSDTLLYKPCFCDRLAKNDGDSITCLLVVDVLSQGRTPQQPKRTSLKMSTRSWPCVAVGHQSGHITFYTEDGVTLLRQRLHEGAVISIKCRTGWGTLGSSPVDENEQLLILYENVLVTIDAFSLLQTLRVCWNQLQKAQMEILSQLNLTYKKWELSSQGRVCDVESCGIMTESLFDYLKEACAVGGYNMTIRGVPSAVHKYISVGASPMIGIYTASQDSGQPLFSEVAVAMASRLKSAVMSKLSFASGWLPWGSKESQASLAMESKVEEATPLTAACHVSDPRRVVTSIVLSPNWKMALTTDELGRVMLLDCENFVIKRIWKGYREAQCGFSTSSEKFFLTSEYQEPRAPRVGTFVIMYARKRGILEVWPTGPGSRIAAFNVGFGCRLLYNGCRGLIGNRSISESVLLKSDGCLEDIRIPFYHTLNEKDRSSFADHHALSQIQHHLNMKSSKEISLVSKLIGQLQTVAYLKKVIRLVLQCLFLSVSDFLDCFDAIRNSLLRISAVNVKSSAMSENVRQEIQELLNYCDTQGTLLELYQDICNCRLGDCSLSISEKSDGTLQQFQHTFRFLDSEASFLWTLLENFVTRHSHLLMTGEEAVERAQRLKPGDFLCYINILIDESSNKGNAKRLSSMRKSDMQFAVLGTFLIMPCLSGQYSVTDLFSLLNTACVTSSDVMHMVISCLLTTPILDHSNVDVLQQLYSFVREIVTCNPVSADVYEPCVLMDWWKPWMVKLENSSHPYRALLLSFVCCCVSKSFALDSKESTAQSDDDDWESVNIEVETWSVLVHRLEDLLCLSTVILSLDNANQYDLTVAKLVDERQDIFVQLVADYIVTGQFDVEAVSWGEHIQGNDRSDSADNITEEDDQPEVSCAEVYSVTIDERSMFLVEDLKMLRSRFPNTLKPEILHIYCAYAAACLWTKDVEVVSYLEVSLSHLCATKIFKSEMACILWREFFRNKIQALSLLIEKVGRAPKDRLCRKNVELSIDSIPSFLHVGSMLLEEMQAGASVESVSSQIFQAEQLWPSNKMMEVKLETGLWRKVTCETRPGVSLIKHHYVLCLILHAVTSLSIKSIKPLSLFNSRVNQLLFNDFNSDLKEVTVDDPSLYHAAGVHSFVEQVVTSSVGHLSFGEDLVVTWFDRSLKLCKLLQCDDDLVRKLYVKLLYRRGLDSHAEETLFAVKDRICLGRELLPILGWRLSTAMTVDENKQRTMAMIPHLPPGVFEWLKSCKSTVQEVRMVSSVYHWPSIKKFAKVVMSLIPDDESEYNTAARLADALESAT
ncbi:rab3 GTPase-activating protein non-catalytic subunit-like isoform X2 [Corticium candelabrum]|uniref:rab3 GTPase-activating protein non-catalytic subunit-like isoform X2 n=1 Tax=Corticium candelabrum TaxID=121492 RepID=UPI002E25B4BB|nr:rab3 GTPase-activating protein non-catalytic subunit-like isoform X2 [Corticium candelabrum]